MTWFGYSEDVTERKQQETVLFHNWRLLKTAADANPAVTYLKDEQHRYVMVNQAFCEVHGLEEAQVLGKDPVEVAGDQAQAWNELDREILASGKTVVDEAFVVQVRGQERVFHQVKRPLAGPAGERMILGMAVDITRERLQQRALAEARDAAEAASRAKSAFLANMSHEIRTPMNGILGMVELLLRMPLGDQQREYVATMRRSGQSLMALLNDILDLTKIESGRMALEVVDFALRPLLADCVNLMRPMAAQKRIELAFELAPDLPEMVQGDPLRLQQVLNNLLGNAIKFTTVGTVSVSARPCTALGSGGLELRVHDTGPGMDAEVQALLFQPFTQADHSTARHFGGTGLGLTITRHIVEAMGGRIEVRSAPGEGSEFCVRVRLGVSTRQSSSELVGSLATVSMDQPHTGDPNGRVVRLRVLVAEDNPVNQLYARGVLERLGHGVELVSDGEQAIARAQSDTAWDVILMDCRMPGVDGFEATRRIRLAERASGRTPCPIVAVTASTMTEEVQRCLQSGMDDVLAKPFSVDEMARVLERVTRGDYARSA